MPDNIQLKRGTVGNIEDVNIISHQWYTEKGKSCHIVALELPLAKVMGPTFSDESYSKNEWLPQGVKNTTAKQLNWPFMRNGLN